MDVDGVIEPADQPVSPARRCLLVSRPLSMATGPDEFWRTIGRVEYRPSVPSLLELTPIVQHWALCIIPDGEHDYTSDACRQMFLDADYFDLGVDSSSICGFSSSTSRSPRGLCHNTRWAASSVMSITSLYDVGTTTRANDWIAERGSDMCRSWGTYSPLDWNCQHFAVLLAQIAIDTDESARVMCRILRRRSITLAGIQSQVRMLVGSLFSVAGAFQWAYHSVEAALSVVFYMSREAYLAEALTHAGMVRILERFDEVHKMFQTRGNGPRLYFVH